jgi:hypothetical protein
MDQRPADAEGRYLPHLLPVDQTLHWANPAGGEAMRDDHGTDQKPYTGPVPMIVHVHGARAEQESDGYAEAWYLPAASNIPAGYAAIGSWYSKFKDLFKQRWGVDWEPGTAVAQYEPPARLHDVVPRPHAGHDALNVYAGPAGFFLLRGGPGDLTAGLPGQLRPRRRARHALLRDPLAIQDRSFSRQLGLPDNRAFFEA